MFEGLKFDLEEGIKMEITRPDTGEVMTDKDGNPAYIMTLSMDSDKGRDAHSRMQNKMLQKQQKKAAMTAEELREQEVELLSELVTGWYIVDLDGNPMDNECDKDTAKRLFREAPWIREQVSDFAGDLANFTNK